MSKIYGPLVINLDKRVDRIREINKEFEQLNLTYIRFPATLNEKNPALGCIDSHCRVLEEFLKTEDDLVFVCEDDAQFKCSRVEIDKHMVEFVQSKAQVFCLGFYVSDPKPYTNLFLRSSDIQNRVAYVVKREAAPELIQVWRKLYLLLITNGHKKENSYEKEYMNLPIINKAADIYRGDQAWKLCQQSLIFVIPKKNMVVQRESFSDIEQKLVNYGH